MTFYTFLNQWNHSCPVICWKRCKSQNIVKSSVPCMKDGGVDMTVIDCWQNQLGQMADFLPLLTFLIFDLWKLGVHTSNWISNNAVHTDELIYRNFIWKIYGPIIKSMHLWVCTKSMHLHIPISLSSQASLFWQGFFYHLDIISSNKA